MKLVVTAILVLRVSKDLRASDRCANTRITRLFEELLGSISFIPGTKKGYAATTQVSPLGSLY